MKKLMFKNALPGPVYLCESEDGDSKKVIRVAYQIATPESSAEGDYAERGWDDEDGQEFENTWDAARFIAEKGGVANGPHCGDEYWHSVDPEYNRAYYEKGEEKFYTFHPDGWTKEEIQDIEQRLRDHNFTDPADYDEERTDGPARVNEETKGCSTLGGKCIDDIRKCKIENVDESKKSCVEKAKAAWDDVCSKKEPVFEIEGEDIRIHFDEKTCELWAELDPENVIMKYDCEKSIEENLTDLYEKVTEKLAEDEDYLEKAAKAEVEG